MFCLFRDDALRKGDDEEQDDEEQEEGNEEADHEEDDGDKLRRSHQAQEWAGEPARTCTNLHDL